MIGYEERERQTLARWSAIRLRALVAAVEAGNRNSEEGWEAADLAEVFELRFIADEVERRGWPPLRIGPG